MPQLAQSLRHAVRSLWADRGSTSAALLILMLGIGMSTAMFTVYRAVVLRAMPVRSPDRIIVLRPLSDDAVELPLSAPQFESLSMDARTMSDVAAFNHYGAASPVPMTEGDRPVVMRGAGVSANFFDVLGAVPELGRLMRPEDRDAASRVTVISFEAWQRLFGGDPAVLGRHLTTTADQQTYTIVGVAPPGLDFPTGADYWLAMPPGPLPGYGFDVVARLAPGASQEAARAEFLSITRRLDEESPAPFGISRASVLSFEPAVLGDSRAILSAGTASVLLLLLIACLNVAGLLVLRGTRRAREIAVRRALGAGSARLVRGLLAENTLLGIGGGLLGLGLAFGILRAVPFLAASRIPREEMIRIAGQPLGLGIGVTVVAVLLFGTIPALVAARGDPAVTLRQDARSGLHPRSRHRARRALVAGQVAVSVVIVSGAGLLIRSVERLEHVDLGYEADHLAIGLLAIPFADYGSQQELNTDLGELFGRLHALSGVTALTPIIRQPFVGANVWQTVPVVEGQSSGATNAPIPIEAGGPEYFRTFGIPILRGRPFADTDDADAPLVLVVSESTAARLWPGQNPLGKRVQLDAGPWWSVVGVAGDIRFRRLAEATPMLYLPWRQLTTQGYFALRTQGSLADVVPAIRSTVKNFDPRLDVWDVRTMDDYLDGPLSRPRLGALLLVAFGATALLVAGIGLYALMASSVGERTHEFGIRIAVGASSGRLHRVVVGDAVAVTAAGVLAGSVGAVVGGRLMSALLFGVTPSDPVTLAAVSLLLLAVLVAAAVVPVRRATRVQPMKALRAD